MAGLAQLAFAALFLAVVTLALIHLFTRRRRPREFTPTFSSGDICKFVGGPLDGRYLQVPPAATDYWAHKPTGPMLGVWKTNALGITRTKVRYERTGPMEFTVECLAGGEHEWEFRDDSFDHALGTEQIHSEVCEKCGTRRRAEPPSFDDDAA